MKTQPLIDRVKKSPFIRDRVIPLIATPTRRRLARGAFWGSIGGVATKFVTLIMSFLLARILGQVGFGEYGIINSTSAMIGGLAGLGLGVTVTKYVAELRKKDPQRAGRIIALSSMVAWISAVIYGVSFIGFAPWLAENTLAAPHLASMLRISSITIAFGVINGVQTSLLSGLESFKINSIVSSVCGAFQSILVVVFASVWGLPGAVIALAASMCVTVFFTFLFVRKELAGFSIPFLIREGWQEWKVLVRFSLPSFLCGMSVGPILWGCSAMLANRPDGYAQLGIFNAANQWQNTMQYIPTLIGSAVLPVMSERHGMGDAAGGYRVMNGMMVLTAAITIPIGVILSLASPWVMAGYGESFRGGYWVLVITVLTAALMSIVTPIGQYIASRGNMWILFWMNLGWGIVMLVCSWWMVQWGAEGLAGARMIAYIFHAVWSFWYVARFKKT